MILSELVKDCVRSDLRFPYWFVFSHASSGDEILLNFSFFVCEVVVVLLAYSFLWGTGLQKL